MISSIKRRCLALAIKEQGTERNAGEWAELYVLLETLAQGKLYAADEDTNKIENQYMPVIKINMQKASTGKALCYVIDVKNQSIQVEEAEKVTETISMSEFKVQAKEFFNIISTRKSQKSGKKLVFSVPEIFPLLEKMGMPETKKSSAKKADIHMVVHDVMTGLEQEVGFSIKSKHSSPATLINPSGQTLFRYQICKADGGLIDKEELKRLLQPIGENGKSGAKPRIKNLYNSGYCLEFVQVLGEQFRENLCLIDRDLEVILSEALKIFMNSKGGDLKKVIEEVSNKNPCNYRTEDPERIYEHYVYKIKKLVTDSALGMRPGDPWSGKYDATGGYLIVKDQGDVVCYYLYNWNALQEYLFTRLKFETPSSTGKGSKKSYNYALYVEEDNTPFVDICLQLRFK